MADAILVVDDEPSIRKVLSAQLKRAGYQPFTVSDGMQALDHIQSDEPCVIITDLRMPHLDGMSLLAWVRSNRPHIPVLLMTAHGSVDSAVQAIKRGAFDYITKPFDQSEIIQVIQKAVATYKAHIREPSTDEDGLIGNTPEMQRVFRIISKAAPSPTTVLITGESGTGKELIARAIHNQSLRADQPFVQINCGAIPESLFESELFGYEKGAFTGANRQKLGRFELANGGTLFLDEVGELPKEVQVKLLRALQERQIDRVGGLHPVSIDVRVIAATNVDIKTAVQEGRFREDLYWRLHVLHLPLPSLRERRDDIPLLAEHFRARFNERLGRSIGPLNSQVLHALTTHQWPGNIRELENLMERAILLAEGEELDINDLNLPQATRPEPKGLKEYVREETAKLERSRIITALEIENGNVTRASKRLSISRKSLQNKMKEYGLRE